MGSYTMELRNYIEMWSQYETLSIREQIEKGRTKLFDFDYPLFDPDYKKQFETNFIRKFYMREIGFETEGLFKFQLETWLLINMPYYNKLFESELLQYDPLTNHKFEITKNLTKVLDKTDLRNTTSNRTDDVTNNTEENVTSSTDGTSNQTTNNTSTTDGTESKDKTNTQTSDNFDRQLESTTPDSRLALTANDGEGVIQYASKINENNENNKLTTVDNADGTNHSETVDEGSALNTTNVDTTGNSITDSTTNIVGSENRNDKLDSDATETEEYAENRAGKMGDKSYPTLVKEYREALLRIEKQIFEEMQELFMLVY